MCKCLYLGMYTMYMLGTLGGQKGASFALALELQVLVSYHPLGPRNQTQILFKSNSPESFLQLLVMCMAM